jgi:hypothetical protein
MGTASLMLAVVANQMVGAMGSVLVGVLFALLFHVVNFAIGVLAHHSRCGFTTWSSSKFFSPVARFVPLGHWHSMNQGR